MRIFVTGATGFLGSAIVQELIATGYNVLGLARSDTSATSLVAAGAEVQHGSLEDLDSLRRGAADSDAVIHTAFNHDFSQFAENCQQDKHVIETLGAELKDSERPLLVTAALASIASTHGHAAAEDDPAMPVSSGNPRGVSEMTALSLASQGVHASVVRLPQIHNPDKQGLISFLTDIAQDKGVSAYIGEGHNRWAAVHRLDAARLYRLVLEHGAAGGRYHPVAEEGVPFKDIATAIGRRIGVPVVSKPTEESAEHFGPLSHFVEQDMTASSRKTRELLGWQPTGPDLLSDIAQSQT